MTHEKDIFMRFRLFLSVLCIFTVCHSNAQNGKLYDADKYLPSSFINQIYLDKDGFLWIATRNGLSKYDGYQFYTYRKERTNKMRSSYVNYICQDNNGLFYLGLYGGLQTFDGTSFQDVNIKDLEGKNITCYVTCFAQEGKNVLVGTSGHGVLLIDSPNEAHQIGGDYSKIETADRILVDKQQRTWILTSQQGVMLYQHGKLINTFFQEESLKSNIRRICEDKRGNIYIGTFGKGIFIYENGCFRRIDELGFKPVLDMFCAKDGRIIIGYNGGGIGIYNPEDLTITDNPYYNYELDLSQTKVATITQDNGGNLWIGMLQKGIFMYPSSSENFGYMGYKRGEANTIGQACVTSTHVDRRGYIWVGTDKDGLYCLNERHELVKHLKKEIPTTILTIGEDENGKIWIGSFKEGCGQIDPITFAYTPLLIQQLREMSVFGIVADEQGNVWISTMGNGLIKLSVRNGKIKNYRLLKGGDSNRKINCLANDFISHISLSEDSKRLYLSTTMGICCLDIEKEDWVNTLGQNAINYGTPIRVAKEFDGIVWYGTTDGDGLYAFDLKQHKTRLITKENGICDNGIATIEKDKKGNLWIGTDHGLCNYQKGIGVFWNYYTDNGIQSNEFSDGASYTIPTGQMLFGGVCGITWFDPLSIIQGEWKASVKLTAFLINGEPVNTSTRSGGYQVCRSNLTDCRHFELGYEDNSFTLQFSTLTFDSPEHITYLYSINDNPFVRLRSGLNEILFTHLQPGTYHFRVKAERNHQQTEEMSFTIVIHSPWYRTGWAYSFYFLALLLACAYLGFDMRRKAHNKLMMQEYIHAEELSEAKLSFFMNISHEIRTPMTLIITPLLSLMKNEKDPQRLSVYETIKRNAERILNLINQMMDLRKIDKGQMKMRMSETNLIDFIAAIMKMFEYQAKKCSIKLNFVHEMDDLPIWIDTTNFDKVIINILSNAFKFTPTGGEITLRIYTYQQQATIAISNSGERIPDDQLEKIFERFFQSDSVTGKRNAGTGIGLDLTRSLVELHYGNIYARNLEKGCEFVITLPLGNQHLKQDEMIDQSEEKQKVPLIQETDDAFFDSVPEKKKPSHSLTILIAEDEDDIRDYLVKELSQEYTVYACTNGNEALKGTYRIMPDLVLSDVMMPEMDGLTLCSRLKTNHATNHIPVILLTAKNSEESKLEGMDIGADAYIVKPFNLDILRKMIINLINSRQLLRMKYGQTEKLDKLVDDINLKSPDDRLMERMMECINNHISDSTLSVDIIASEIGISRGHLHLKVKELTGETPHGLIRNIRLKRAASLLKEHKMNISEIVYACGFQSTAAFSTMFKNAYGMSPRAYMNLSNNGGA